MRHDEEVMVCTLHILTYSTAMRLTEVKRLCLLYKAPFTLGDTNMCEAALMRQRYTVKAYLLHWATLLS